MHAGPDNSFNIYSITFYYVPLLDLINIKVRLCFEIGMLYSRAANFGMLYIAAEHFGKLNSTSKKS